MVPRFISLIQPLLKFGNGRLFGSSIDRRLTKRLSRHRRKTSYGHVQFFVVQRLKIFVISIQVILRAIHSQKKKSIEITGSFPADWNISRVNKRKVTSRPIDMSKHKKPEDLLCNLSVDCRGNWDNKPAIGLRYCVVGSTSTPFKQVEKGKIDTAFAVQGKFTPRLR